MVVVSFLHMCSEPRRGLDPERVAGATQLAACPIRRQRGRRASVSLLWAPEDVGRDTSWVQDASLKRI